MDLFTTAYIDAIIWTNEEKEFNGISVELTAQAVADCDRFRKVAGSLLDEWPDEQAGHDFWLTRSGHGVGFWDRKSYPHEDALSALVGWQTEFPEIDCYVGDDKMLYAM